MCPSVFPFHVAKVFFCFAVWRLDTLNKKQVYPWFLGLLIRWALMIFNNQLTNCEFEDGGTCLWSRSRGGILVPKFLAVPNGRVTCLRERLHWHRVSRGGRGVRRRGMSRCFWVVVYLVFGAGRHGLKTFKFRSFVIQQGNHYCKPIRYWTSTWI